MSISKDLDYNFHHKECKQGIIQNVIKIAKLITSINLSSQ